jgi:hypothetical protein
MKILIVAIPQHGVATGQIVSADIGEGVVVSGSKEKVVL